jgi:hypothetical protein
MAGMLPLLVSRVGHQTDLALRSQEEMDMVIKEAQAAKHNLEKQISRIIIHIQVKSYLESQPVLDVLGFVTIYTTVVWSW